jgi:hypothetical protein
MKVYIAGFMRQSYHVRPRCTIEIMAKLFVQTRLSPLEKLKVWRKLRFLNALTGSKTWDPPSTATGATSAATTHTVTGAVVGDHVYAKFSNPLPAGVVLLASVSAPDTVSVSLRNDSGSTVDLASGTLSVRVEKKDDWRV